MHSPEQAACSGLGAREGLPAVASTSSLDLGVFTTLLRRHHVVGIHLFTGRRAPRTRRQCPLLRSCTRARDAHASAVFDALARGAGACPNPYARVRRRCPRSQDAHCAASVLLVFCCYDIICITIFLRLFDSICVIYCVFTIDNVSVVNFDTIADIWISDN